MKLHIHVVNGPSFLLAVGDGNQSVRWLATAAASRARKLTSVLDGKRVRRRETMPSGMKFVGPRSVSALDTPGGVKLYGPDGSGVGV